MADTERPAEMPHPADGRKFGYWPCHFAVVGSMIGAGILTTSGSILRETGNPSALLGLWALGGLLAVCGAVTVAELAATLPRSGGDYIFVREAFGRGAGFVSGWATFTLGFAAPTAVVAHLALTYLTAPFMSSLSAVLPAWLAPRLIPLGASSLILAVGVAHAMSHRHSSWLQVLATVVTALVLLLIAVGGLLLGHGNWGHFSAGGWPTAPQWPVLALGLVYVSYSYAGWNAAAYLAGEVRDPVRILPRALIGGAVTVIALYLLVNVTYVYALEPAGITARSADEVRPVAELAVRELFGPTAGVWASAAFGLCLLATVSAFVLTGSRVAFAMSRDGVFPGFAARLHPTTGTPAAATLTLAASSAALVWAGTFLELLDYASVGLAALTGLTVASVFPLRRRPDLAHAYRLPLYPLPPLAFLTLTALAIGCALVEERSRLPSLLSLATLLVAIPLSFLFPRRELSKPARQ